MSAALKPVPEPLDVNAFILANGRFPHLGVDPHAPWEYRGWLLVYLQMGDREKAPEVIDRWSYHLRTLEAGELLDEPIPPIRFVSAESPEAAAGAKEFRKWLDIIYHDTGSLSAFPALLEWLAWGLAVTREPSRLAPAMQEKLYRGVNLEPLLKTPADYLGSVYQDTRSNKFNNTGFFATPMQVVEMMALIVNGEPGETDRRREKTCDPCVGSGRFLLSASNYSLCLLGMDIDATCVLMTKINGAFYAPWLAFPFSDELLTKNWVQVNEPGKPQKPSKAPLDEVAERPPACEIWEMTADEYMKSIGVNSGAARVKKAHKDHSLAVYQAVAEGRTLPEKVRQEYPNAVARVDKNGQLSLF